MADFKLAAPWTTYYRELQTLFKQDPEVKVLFTEGARPEIKIYTESTVKAEALSKVLPDKKTFGNVPVYVTVIPGNKAGTPTGDLMEDLFKGNEAVASIEKIRFFGGAITYVIFKKEVVQFFNDDLSDIRGLCSTLYQNIAKDVLENVEGIFFCTDIGAASVGVPLGEWP